VKEGQNGKPAMRKSSPNSPGAADAGELELAPRQD